MNASFWFAIIFSLDIFLFWRPVVPPEFWGSFVGAIGSTIVPLSISCVLGLIVFALRKPRHFIGPTVVIFGVSSAILASLWHIAH